MPHQANHRSISHRASGFTLVELLVSITILVILASVTLYGMASVQKMAMIQRAKSQIARLHELIMEKWETYETRSVGEYSAPTPLVGAPESMLRLLAARELIRLELPDRFSDIADIPTSPEDDALVMLSQRPSLSRYYQRRIGAATDIQPAECLYLIISRMQVGDASALEFFSEDEIGDFDGDGLPEILDPWGTPITFIRWPAGFAPSPMMSATNFGDPFDLTGEDEKRVREHHAWFDRDEDGPLPSGSPPDPDDRPFALVPLIASAGPDGAFDIDVGNIDYTDFSIAGPYQRIPNDPYAYIEAGAGYPAGQDVTRAGAPADTNQNGVPEFADNITNHSISSSIK